MDDLIDITTLKPHPMNKEIYGGNEDINDLAEQIKKSNWIKPIVITADKTIISGHRRYYACLKLGIKEIPYLLEKFDNKTEEIERLLLENQTREKTNYQKVQEAKMWEKIEKEKAKERQGQRTDLNNNIVEKFPQGQSGKTRDIVADKVGLGSGKTYQKAKEVAQKIDDLKAEGKKEDAEFLNDALEQIVNGAKKIIDNVKIENIPDETKEKVIKKEVTAKKAIQEIKKDLSPEETQKEDLPVESNDTNSIIENFQSDIDLFIKSMNKYVDMEEAFENMEDEQKRKVMIIIAKMESTINEIKTNLA